MPLTTNQHTFPKASIDRFGTKDNENFLVQVYLKKAKEPFLADSKNKVFCANHIWDQRLEAVEMKRVEDSFQSLAHDIISKQISTIGVLEKNIVNDFYSLWNIRTHIKNMLGRKGLPDLQIDGRPSMILSEDGQVDLEKAGITPVRPDGTILGRFFTKSLIKESQYEDRERLKNEEWGIIEAESGEFLVPDNSYHDTFVPLSPTLCLLSKSQNRIISQEEVAQVNRFVFDTSIDYFFARDFVKCPISLPEQPNFSTVDQFLKSI